MLVQSVGAALSAAGTEVRHQSFLAAILYTLRFQLVAHLVCLLLMFLLPGNPRPLPASPALQAARP